MDEVIQISDDDKMDTSILSSENGATPASADAAVTSSGRKPSSKLDTPSARSASGSNLKLQSKIESAKKREEEKERKERERREKEEQRLKKEADAKRKREEEEALRKKKAEEARLKKEEEKARKEEEERERKRKREEEERERKRKAEEARLKREEEKARKEEEERERKRKLEEVRLKTQEEKEKQAQERYEKELRRLEALSARNEEQKRRDEERQREEALAAKTKNRFENYFTYKKETKSKDQDQSAASAVGSKSSRFMSFQLKANMSLAPPIRRTDCFNMNDEQRAEFIAKLDKELKLGDAEGAESAAEPFRGLSYLDEIRKNPNLIRKQTHGCRRRKPGSSKSSVSSSSDEVKIIDVTSNVSKFKVKYLHFDSKIYRRPPYFGTWRKRSKVIGPKTPFGKDEKLIDYEVDSDDEWEDEADGESIADSEKGGDQEQEELGDDEDDDGFFVPHGHLSDDELDEDERNLDPETKKARENAKKEQYETERKKVSRYLVPKCFTIHNLKSDFLKPSDLEDIKHLDRLRMVPIASVKLPVVIQTEEVLEKLAAQKAADDAAQKLAIKAAKQAAVQLESMNAASPTSTTKSTKNNKAKQLVQATSTSSPGAQSVPASPAPAPTNNTPTILSFISKKSNKKVECLIQPLHGSTAPAPVLPPAPQPPVISSVENSAKSVLPESTGSTPSAQTPKPMTPGLRLESDAKSRTPILTGPMASPKMTPTSVGNLNTSCSTAEKRVKCLNSSNNEEENSGKRLKLESETGQTEIIKAATSTNTPANAAIVISTLFRSSSCKKSLKLSSSAKKSANENATAVQKKSAATSDGATPVASSGRTLVLSESSASSNSPVKMMDATSSDSGAAAAAKELPRVKIRPIQFGQSGSEPDKNKENDQAFITLD